MWNKSKWKRAVRAGKGFTRYQIMSLQVMKSLEDSNVLIDGITETVKTETKNKKK